MIFFYFVSKITLQKLKILFPCSCAFIWFCVQILVPWSSIWLEFHKTISLFTLHICYHFSCLFCPLFFFLRYLSHYVPQIAPMISSTFFTFLPDNLKNTPDLKLRQHSALFWLFLLIIKCAFRIIGQKSQKTARYYRRNKVKKVLNIVGDIWGTYWLFFPIIYYVLTQKMPKKSMFP